MALNPKHREFKVSLSGLVEGDAKAVRRALDLSQGRARKYREAEATTHDIQILAEGTVPVSGAHPVPTLLVPELAPLGAQTLSKSHNGGTYLIDRPLLATRVLRRLDQVTMELFEDIPELDVGSEDTPAARDSGMLEHAAATRITQDFSGLVGLVVDDSLAVRKQMELLLHAAKVRVSFAASGQEALSLVDREKFDFVFLDIAMPGIDGYKVCRAMRRAHRELPIVMLTGKGSPLSRARGTMAGANAYLTKPVSLEMLRKTMHTIIARAFSAAKG